MGYQTILFDLDGTLLDTLGDLHAAVNATMRHMGRREHTVDEVRAFVGNGAEMLMRRALGAESTEDEVRAALAWYLPYYNGHCDILTRPYDGVLPVLRALKAAGKRLAVVSNKGDETVKALNALHFEGMMDAAVGETAGIRRKPAPDMMDASLAALGAEKAGAVYVGDSEVDVAFARAAGVPLIGVSWGFRGREALRAAGAETVIDRPEELAELVG